VDVIKDHCMKEHLQEEMRAAVKSRTDMMWLQNESIYQAFVRPALSREIIEEVEGRLE